MESVTGTEERPQRRGQRFANPWPGFERHGFADLLKWTIERRANRDTADSTSLPGPTEHGIVGPRAEPHVLVATWIGHTSALLQIGGLNVLTDPIWSDRASPVSFAGPKRFNDPGVSFDDLPVIDGVVLSHNHYDHLDASTVKRLIRRFPAAAWHVPLGVADFIRSRGALDVEALGWHETTTMGPLRLVCVPAQHFSGRGLFDRNRTLWCGWVLSCDSHSVFFAGDTALHPSFATIGKQYGPFDLALMPIGAYDPRWFMRSVHMDPEECVSAVKLLSPSPEETPVLLATHWGTFKLTDEPVGEPPVRMRRAWDAAGLPPERLWIARLGESRLL